MQSINPFFQKVDRLRYSEQVGRQIQALIEREHLLPGDQLPSERQLCVSFGVSRTVIREAVKGLAQIGLVTVEIGRGTFVAQPNARQVSESLALWARVGDHPFENLIEVRRALEIEIAGLAAERAQPADLERLREALDKMECSLADLDVYIQADNQFHQALAQATQNDLFLILQNSIVDLLQGSRVQIFHTPGAPGRGQAHHHAIYHAVECHNAASARDQMRLHLQQIKTELIPSTTVGVV
jgi:GntR family transcriptional regulator, transcriptional repressor for pyruvate dehydrogenase complex